MALLSCNNDNKIINIETTKFYEITFIIRDSSSNFPLPLVSVKLGENINNWYTTDGAGMCDAGKYGSGDYTVTYGAGLYGVVTKSFLLVKDTVLTVHLRKLSTLDTLKPELISYDINPYDRKVYLFFSESMNKLSVEASTTVRWIAPNPCNPNAYKTDFNYSWNGSNIYFVTTDSSWGRCNGINYNYYLSAFDLSNNATDINGNHLKNSFHYP